MQKIFDRLKKRVEWIDKEGKNYGLYLYAEKIDRLKKRVEWN